MVHVTTFDHNTWNFSILINDNRHYIQNIILQICNHFRGISLDDQGPVILISKVCMIQKRSVYTFVGTKFTLVCELKIKLSPLSGTREY
jgi:hypothetical protein